MSYLYAIFLGIVQGVAEFLPISSSGHLSIFQHFLNLQNPEESNLFFDGYFTLLFRNLLLQPISRD